MKPVEIKINNIEYTSVGEYIDNNNGIFHYCPDDTIESWINFLKSEQPSIILWLLSCLQDDNLGMSNSFTKIIIELGGEELITFLKKYCWENILNDIFVDFNFGPYSNNSSDNVFPEIRFNDKIIEQEDFEFTRFIFIKSNKYSEFIKDLEKIINLLFAGFKSI
jgi:hypothetical protein